MTADNKRFALAILLSASVLFLWQFFFPPAPVADKAVVAPAKQEIVAPAPIAVSEKIADQEFQNFFIENDKSKLLINNSLGFVDFISHNQKSTFAQTVGSDKPFAVYTLADGVYRPVFLNFKSESGTKVIGQSQDQSLSFSAEVMENGKVAFSFVSAVPQRYRLQFHSPKEKLSNGQIRHFVLYSKDVERFDMGSSEKGDGISKWLGVDFNYHFFGVVFKENQPLRYQATEDGTVTIDLVNPVANFSGDFVFLKKNYDELLALGDNLQLSVDFGFFAILAIPMLHIMQWLYKVIPNYGVAIIILTLLMRLVLYPLQHKSAMSMKKMQKVQPELKRIQEKFKEDPQRVQKETMELFKRSGANPLGGCLPLLLQMPIFFAIYKVLYSSVELVDAPFFGWIADLSQKDPFYVLPVLMAITMFLQQKITPSTTMDSTQQKVMLAMPLIFGFIMKDLPSGLVLYIFVSTLFGYLQQLLTYKFTD